MECGMRTDDFDFKLPPSLIAQYPSALRDDCRLLLLSRKTGTVSDHAFTELTEFLSPGDRLVFNNTRVVPARVFCKKVTGGAVELLFTEPAGSMGEWKALIRPGKGLGAGTKLVLKEDPGISLDLITVYPDGMRGISLAAGSPFSSIPELMEKHGVMALPHYIKRPAEKNDNQNYQTVYAQREGAIASPTAGLHFTRSFLNALTARGIGISYVTLHVGIGTFKPVKVDDPADHIMHEERYEIAQKTVDEIMETKKNGGRVVAVGTTVVRVLEHCAGQSGTPVPSQGKTSLKILPGYTFKVIDGMVTNFHVPKSTLLMLVSAFAGREAVLAAYRHAVAERYRFFSYGDAMLFL
jgi:S-adenosylmethionine:tRNA ribosyltransferase-isomerase